MFQKHLNYLTRIAYLKCIHCDRRFVSCSAKRFSSTNTDVSFRTENDEAPNTNQASLNSYKRSLQKKTPLKITRKPFMKNLFVGKFDQDILAFPEIHDNSEIEVINKMSDEVRRFVVTNVDSEQIDRNSNFPDVVLHNMKKMGLFGSRVPKEYGGLDSSATEHVRLMEACSLDGSLPVLINTHHSIAAQGLLNHASDELKNLYLPKVATGELMATTCVFEEGSENDFSCINTEAKKMKNSNTYLLSGKKTLVVNAADAGLFLVLARVVDPEVPEMSDGLYSAFLVEKDSPGIAVSNPSEPFGVRGCNVCSVEFHDTPVPQKNIIGAMKSGHEVLLDISMMSRFHLGAYCSGLAKALFELAVKHCISHNLFLKPLMEFESTHARLGKILRKIYSMESITYLTAGLFDSTQDPDLNVECTAVKVFCTESLWYCVNEILNLIGPTATESGHPVERALRDCKIWLNYEGSNDLLRQFITLSGLNHVKDFIADDVQKLRNPLFHPMFSFRKILENHRHERGSLTLSMDLQGYLHPSLQIQAKNMEYAVQRLQHAFSILLQRHGPDMPRNEVGLCRLADIAIEIFIMAATCSRSSRAYCIGLPCAKTEVSLAMTACHDGYEKVNRLHSEIYKGPGATTDLDYLEISKEAFRKQGYCLTPPFTRTY